MRFAASRDLGDAEADLGRFIDADDYPARHKVCPVDLLTVDPGGVDPTEAVEVSRPAYEEHGGENLLESVLHRLVEHGRTRGVRRAKAPLRAAPERGPYGSGAGKPST
jgi:hypothetical protein